MKGSVIFVFKRALIENRNPQFWSLRISASQASGLNSLVKKIYLEFPLLSILTVKLIELLHICFVYSIGGFVSE